MRRLFSPEKEKALTQEYLSGAATMQQIADREHCDHTTLHKIVQRNASKEERAAARSRSHSRAKTGVPCAPATIEKLRKVNGRPPVYRVCRTCGALFKVKPYKVRNGRGHYCKPACYHAALVGHEPTNKIGQKAVCAGCGIEFDVAPSRLTGGRGKYCSRVCVDTHRPHQSGPAHHNWKGGTTDIKLKIRNSSQYFRWRSAVFKRDNYTCQRCGARGVYVEAHHKQSFAEHPELRFDVDNGITLCVPCHADVDPHRSRFVPKRRRKKA